MLMLDTPRLLIRPLEAGDAPFILQLLNEPSWLKNIGDKGVRSIADAEHYIRTGPSQMLATYGFGSRLLRLKASGEAIGMCGLIKRDSLPEPDLGFALLPAFWGQGYAREAAEATLTDGTERLGIRRVLAICNPDNLASSKLLEALGFVLQGSHQITPEAQLLKLYARDAKAV